MRRIVSALTLVVAVCIFALIIRAHLRAAVASWSQRTTIGPVERVIQENLASWRFQPGEEVFSNPGRHGVFKTVLTASPGGRLFLAWSESSGRWDSVVVRSSGDGRTWEPETTVSGRIRAGPMTCAANGAGEVVVAWGHEAKVWATHRTAEGVWEARVLVSEGPRTGRGCRAGFLASTADADGAFWLLALVGEVTPLDPPLQLWKREPDGQWVASPAPPRDPYRLEITVGWREGLVARSAGSFVRCSDGRTWRTIGPVPWDPPGDRRSQTYSLWLRPTGQAAALVSSPEIAEPVAALATSADLSQWSRPIFLGVMGGLGRCGVAVTDHDIYVATSSIPHCRTRVPGSPHVFRIDERTQRDTDGDGLTDIAEEWLLTDYQNPDTDGDGTPDGTDLDPLAATTPPTDEAAICQAVFAPRAATTGLAVVVVTPQRQAFAGHSCRVLSLTPDEAGAYRAKYQDRACLLQIQVVEIGLLGRTAKARWESMPGTLGARGGELELRKQNGRWVVTREISSWIS